MTFQNDEVVDLRHRPHFLIIVDPSSDGTWKSARVEVIRQTPDDYGYWMCACEYFLHKTAQLSGEGYEKALELLVKGAMTWKDKEK